MLGIYPRGTCKTRRCSNVRNIRAVFDTLLVLQRLKNQGIYRLFKLNFLYVTRETIIKKSIYKAIVFRQVLLFCVNWLSVDKEYLWVNNY